MKIAFIIFLFSKNVFLSANIIYNEKLLLLTFQRWEIWSSFELKRGWKDDIYWLLKSSCFERFGDGKYGLFFSQNVDEKMTFTWFFWALYDIPRLGKYRFSCSAFKKSHNPRVIGLGITTQVKVSEWRNQRCNEIIKPLKDSD